MESAKSSGIGFLSSLVIHIAILATIFTALHNKDNSQNSINGEVSDTNISIEMMMAMTVSEPAPVQAKQLSQQENNRELVADPTVKPKPEKIKQPEQKREKPKEKSKEKPQEEKKNQHSQPYERPKQIKPDTKAQIGDRVVAGTGAINANKATTSANTNSENLTGNGNNSSMLAEYQSRLRHEIESHQNYPQRLRIMKKQGVTIVAFNIATDGSLTNPRIIKSSGHDDLDNLALQAVQNSSSVGPKPAAMSSSLSVPIKFGLR